MVKVYHSTSISSKGALNNEQNETLGRLILSCFSSCNAPDLSEEITHSIDYDEKEIVEKYTVEDFLDSVDMLDEYNQINEKKEETPDDAPDFSEVIEKGDFFPQPEDFEVSYENVEFDPDDQFGEIVFNEEDASDIFK